MARASRCRALRAGRVGYLTKSAAPEQLISAFGGGARRAYISERRWPSGLAGAVGGDAARRTIGCRSVN